MLNIERPVITDKIELLNRIRYIHQVVVEEIGCLMDTEEHKSLVCFLGDLESKLSEKVGG